MRLRVPHHNCCFDHSMILPNDQTLGSITVHPQSAVHHPSCQTNVAITLDPGWESVSVPFQAGRLSRIDCALVCGLGGVGDIWGGNTWGGVSRAVQGHTLSPIPPPSASRKISSCLPPSTVTNYLSVLLSSSLHISSLLFAFPHRAPSTTPFVKIVGRLS